MAFTAGKGIINLDLGTRMLQSGMAKVGKMMGQFKARMAKMQGAIGGMGTKLAGAAGMGAVVMTFGNFEKAMSKVRALTGATTEEFASMEALAKKLGATTQFSAKQSAEAMTYLGMAGYNTDQIMAAMPSTLNLAAAGAMDLASAADISTNIMSAFQLGADETSRAVDILAKAAASANTDVTQMGEGVKYAGDIARTSGLRLEDTVAAMMSMANVGIRGSMAGTSFAESLAQIQMKADKGKVKIGKWNVQVLDANNNLLPLPTIIDRVNAAMEGMGKAAKVEALTDLVGKRGLKALGPMLTAGGDKLREMITSLEGSGGAAAEMAAIMQDNLMGAMTRVKSALEGVAISIGESLGPGLNKIASWLQGILPSIQGFVENNKGLIAGITAAAAALVGLTVVVPIVTGVIGALGAAIGIIASPIGIVVGGLALLAKHFYDTRLAGDSFGEKVSSLKEIVSGMWSYVSPIWEKFKTGVIWAFVAVKVAIRDWKLSIKLALVAAAYSVLWYVDLVKHHFTKAIPNMLAWFGRNWKAIFVDAANALEAFIQNALLNIMNMWEWLKSWVTGGGYEFEWTPLLDGFERTMEQLPDYFEGFVEGELTQKMGKRMRELGAELGGNIADEFAKYSEKAPDVKTVAESMGEGMKKTAAKAVEIKKNLGDGAKKIGVATEGLSLAADETKGGGGILALTEAMAGLQEAALKTKASPQEQLLQVNRQQLAIAQRREERDKKYQGQRRQDENRKKERDRDVTVREVKSVSKVT